MTQRELIMCYLWEHKSIIPAKMSGEIYRGTMFGSETSKRCRELRKEGKLESVQDGKFEKFFAAGEKPKEIPTYKGINIYKPKVEVQQMML